MPFEPTYEVNPERQAYTVGDGPVGILMLHGFMGAPISSRPLAEHLAARGLTVHCPLLPGHGELPNKLFGISRQAWIGEAEEGFAFISGRCDEVFLMGHSMGTVLGAHLASQNKEIKGMVMLAPAYDIPDKRLLAMSVLRYVLPWFYPLKIRSLRPLVTQRLQDYDPSINLDDPVVQSELPEMTKVPTASIDEMRKTIKMGQQLWPSLDLPVIIFQGDKDIAVPLEKTEKLFEILPNGDKKLRIIPEAGHELMRPFDPAHEVVWSFVREFIEEYSHLLVASATC